jgi:peptidyl-prolyl cis-trans isomerase C
MKTFIGVLLCALLVAAGTTASAFDQSEAGVVSKSTGTKTGGGEAQITLNVPVWSSRFAQFPAALVNDEPITLEDLTNALATSHMDRSEQKTGRVDYLTILNRLINARLVIQEAANIGLDELPEFNAQMEKFSRATLKSLLFAQVIGDVTVDPAEVEKRYRESILEWKINSLLFAKEDEARSFHSAVQAGGSFEELAKKALEEKKAQGADRSVYLKAKEIMPAISSVILSMQTGSISPVIKLEEGMNFQGFAIVKLEDRRSVENDGVRRSVEQSLLAERKNEKLKAYRQELFKKYVEVRKRTLKRLDYDSPKANRQELLTDTRIVAEIKDEKAITVGDLTAALKEKHYHGLDRAAESKKINQSKQEVLDTLIDKALIHKEALQRGLDKTTEYEARMKEFRTNTLFGLFIERVVYPDFKLHESDVKEYYDEHKQEFLSPEIVRMTGLIFTNKRDAETALKSLERGADVSWVRANADGIAADAHKDPLFSGGRIVLAKDDMPEDMRKAVSGAKAGDARLYTGGERFFVLALEEITPSRVKPFEEVREVIRKKIFNEKFNQAVEDWFPKLREAGDVRIFIAAETPEKNKR